MDPRSQAQIDAWLRAASDDAERRGLPQLKPLLEGLARSTAALREAERTLRDAGVIPGTIETEDPDRPARTLADTTE
jgi:hypothetical protein